MMGIRNMLAVPQSSARVRRQQGYSRKSKKPMIEKAQLPQTVPLIVLPSPAAVPQCELDVELRRMHALEHACNGRNGPCCLSNEDNLDLCNRLYDDAVVGDMLRHLQAYNDVGTLCKEVKPLIVRHFSHCRDATCRVPHVAAGCLPAGQNYTPTPSPIHSKTSNSSSPFLPPPHTLSTHSHPPSFTHPHPTHSSHPLLAPRGARVSFDLQPANIIESPTPLPAPREIATDLHPANIYQSSPSHLPGQKGVGAISFDLHPANISESPTHQKITSPVRTPSPRNGHPVTLHTTSDSPHHHVTHIPHCPFRQPLPSNNALVVRNMYVPLGAVENTLLQGTFQSGHKCIPVSRACPSVAEATEEPDMDQGKPRPHLIALPDGRSGYCKVQSIWKSSVPGKFPSANALRPHTIIFSRMVHNMIVGSELQLVDLERSPRLGRGGNGTIFKYPLLNEEYAVKQTRYRTSELNEYHKFDHPNVMKLLILCTYTSPSDCCQFMQLMDDSLSRVIRNVCCDGVCSLYSNKEEWGRLVMPNVRHIIGGVLRGTAYLHDDMCIQHVDLKASNVLIKKRCDCGDILTCQCPNNHKCLVQLADFDSVKQFQKKEFVEHCQWELYVQMGSEECGKVMGTPGYRAPEQFMVLAPVVSPDHFLFNKSLEGPWTDIWDVGHICLTIFLGPNKSEDKHEAWTMHGWPCVKEFSRRYTQPELTHALLRSRQLSQRTPRDVFTSASNFTDACIQPDFRKRPTAQKLLNSDLLRVPMLFQCLV